MTGALPRHRDQAEVREKLGAAGWPLPVAMFDHTRWWGEDHMLTIAITFVVTLAAMFGVYWAIALGRKRPSRTCAAQAPRRRHWRGDGPLKSRLVKPAEQLSAIPAIDRLLRASSQVVAPLQQQLSMAALKMTLRDAVPGVRARCN